MEYDAKLMTLKRWNLPQSQPIFRTKNLSGFNPGNYISFRSHHFIDIADVGTEVIDHHSQGISVYEKMYKTLNQQRNSFQFKDMRNIHMVQSMPLIGKPTSFWEHPADVLYITFLQLTDPTAISYTNLYNKIASFLKKQTDGHLGAGDAQIALYHSLDFCDFVLFTKNVKIQCLQSLLWHLTLNPNGKTSKIRDTFTIHSFGREYLRKCFSNITEAAWDDQMCVSVNLSIQAIDNLNELEGRLEAAGLHYVRKQLYGRYDLNLSFDVISGTDVLRLLYEIDRLFGREGHPDSALGGYEVILSSPLNTPFYKGLPSQKHHALCTVATSVLDGWCSVYSRKAELYKDFSPLSSYFVETICSLEDLLNNGFSDEFILCVLPSFVSLQNISWEQINRYRELAKEDADNPSFNVLEMQREIRNSLNNLWRNYFTALNTLSLCTMHSERQFIQAPAFNASYFEVPPKLLAYYSAVIHNLAVTLHGKQDIPPNYSFTLTPDFREDINVIPLTIYGQKENSQHLAIINLSEKYIYQPASSILLFAHEVAHYVGCRKRELRIKLIFKSLSLKLLQNTLVFDVIAPVKIKKDDILDTIVDYMAEFFFDCYNRMPEREPERKYHKENIIYFLTNFQYGLDLFSDADFVSTFVSGLSKKLLQEVPQSINKQKQFRELIYKIEKTLLTNYYSDLFKADNSNPIPYSIFAEKLASFFSFYTTDAFDPAHQEEKDVLYRYLDTIVQSFCEAYSDYKMFEACGAKKGQVHIYAKELYELLLNQLTGFDSVQRTFRYNAVLCAIDPSRKVVLSKETTEPFDIYVERKIIAYIAKYLSQCGTPDQISHTAHGSLVAFSKNNWVSQVDYIYNITASYRRSIIEGCEKELEKLEMLLAAE